MAATDLAEIEALAAAGESETLELKKSTGERRTGMKTEPLHEQFRWENQPVPDWTVDDLDQTEIVRTLTRSVTGITPWAAGRWRRRSTTTASK